MPTENETSIIHYSHHYLRSGCCGVNGDDNLSGTHQVSRTRITAKNLQNWRQLIRRNKCATTFLDGVEEGVEYYEGAMGVLMEKIGCGPTVPTCIEEHVGSYKRIALNDAPNDPSGYATTIADNKAKIAYLNSIASAKSQLQGLVTLGERKEAMRMIQGRGRQLRDGIMSYTRSAEERAVDVSRSRRFRGRSRAQRVRDLTNSVANTWLEYSFGWRPLVNDLDGAARALARINTQSITYFAYVTGSGNETVEAKGNRSSGSAYFTVKWTAHKVATVDVKYIGKLQLSPSAAEKLETLGLTLENWVPTLWELIPYSFLVDYFTNVGDVIEGWSSNLGSMAWTQQTIRRQHLSEMIAMYVDYDFAAQPTILDHWFSPCGQRWWKRTVVRDRYSGSLIPSFQFRIPGIGSTKWCNIAALGARSAAVSRLFNRLLR